ncbi:dephospho-CoA kinase [Aliikangiella sp. IMCC44653]
MSAIRIGLTGGIASGKSTVSRLFARLGVPIIDADLIARQLFEDNSPHLSQLQCKFGDKIFDSPNKLNRKALRKEIFSSKESLTWLNNFSHPLIAARILEQIKTIDYAYTLIDIPLLIDKEGQLSPRFKPLIQRVLVVDIPSEMQLLRLCERDNISLSDAQSIIQSQATREQRLAWANDIIDNADSEAVLSKQVAQLHQSYLKLAKFKSINS